MKISHLINGVKLYGYSKTNLNLCLPGRIRPYAATVKLTERCNSKCITCNYWQKEFDDLIDTKTAIDLMQQLAQIGVDRLRFSGGEILLRKDFFDILGHVKQLGFQKITIATNGLLIKKYADEINRSCLTDLGVSIDGMKETNDKIRGVKGYFDLVMEGLELIKGKRITIMTTLNNNSHRDLPDLLKICEQNGYLWDCNLLDDRIYFLKDTQIDSIWPSPDEVDKIFNEINKAKNLRCIQRLSDVQLNYAYKYLKKLPIKETYCYLGYMVFYIESQGNVLSGCNYFPPIGNILKDRLINILDSEEYKTRVKSMLYRNCKGCSCGFGIDGIVENLPHYAISRIFQKKGLLP